MERLTFDNELVQVQRDKCRAAYPPEDIAGTLLKPGDDIMFAGFLPLRVLWGHPSPGHASGYNAERFGESIITFACAQVTDRAPLDPFETPMPIYLVPPEPEVPPYEPPTIPDLRQQAFSKIDQRSKALIAVGFDYAGIRFSASLEAQIRFTNMMMLADNLAPLSVNSLDDTAALSLELPDDVRNFCMTALSHVKRHVDDGGAQKKLVRDMTTAEEILAYTDPRELPTDIPVEPGR